jgi:hypothetical protein
MDKKTDEQAAKRTVKIVLMVLAAVEAVGMAAAIYAKFYGH